MITWLCLAVLKGNSLLIHDAARLTTFLCLIKAFCERNTRSRESSDGRVSESGLAHHSSGRLLLAAYSRAVGFGRAHLHFKEVLTFTSVSKICQTNCNVQIMIRHISQIPYQPNEKWSQVQGEREKSSSTALHPFCWLSSFYQGTVWMLALVALEFSSVYLW